MSYVLVSTKPAAALAFQPHLAERYPGRRILGILDNVVSALSFRYARGLTMADYPFVGDPQWRPADPASIPNRRCYEVTGGVRRHLDEDPFDVVRGAETIICGDGTYPGGAANFDALLRYSGGDALADREHGCLWITSLQREAVARGVTEMITTSDARFVRLRDQGRLKRRFEYSFAVNAQALLGAAYRIATGYAEAPAIGKYALQTLYALRDREPVSESDAYKMMTSWAGTGRYPRKSGDGLGLGSMTSRYQIIEDLKAAGLIVHEERGTPPRPHMSITDAGRRFLSALHPDCCDPDLPFRLRAWQEQGLNARPAVDRYIRTFFGKQKRYAHGPLVRLDRTQPPH